MPGPELTSESKMAINTYLKHLSLRFVALFGIVNVFTVWFAYNTVIERAADAAIEAAKERVNTLQKPFDTISGVITQRASDALERVGAAKNEIASVERKIKEFDTESKKVEVEVARLYGKFRSLEDEVKNKSVETMSVLEQQIAITIRPDIAILSPKLDAKGVFLLKSTEKKRKVLGKASHFHKIAYVYINGKEIKHEQSGEFEFDIESEYAGKEIEITATTEKGHSQTIRLGVRAEVKAADQVGLTIAQKSGCKPFPSPTCDNIWSNEGKRSITYCVSKKFGQQYNVVVNAMEQAAQAWETVADVDFIYVREQDENCTNQNENVVFNVEFSNSDAFLSSAFFPDAVRKDRVLPITPSAFEIGNDSKLTLVGSLRHNLGHVLGFRHEHTRQEAGKCFEDDNWRPLGSYDPYSVMHYPQCNGKGDWSLELTPSDKNGAACIYGPSRGFNFDKSLCPRS